MNRHLYLSAAAACLLILLASDIRADVWPVRKSGADYGKRISNYCDFSGRYHDYHTGIDLYCDTSCTFHLVRGGKIVDIDSLGEQLYCLVSTTPDSIIDAYAHVKDYAVFKDSTYAEGTYIGNPATGGTIHLHYGILRHSEPCDQYGPILNPLEIPVLEVDPDPTRLPEVKNIVIKPNDGAGTGTVDTTKTPVLAGGKVDVIANCGDYSPVVIGGDTMFCGVYQIGYTIKNVTYGSGVAQSEVKLLDASTFQTIAPYDFSPSVPCSSIYSLVDPACEPGRHISWYIATNKKSDGTIHTDGCWNTKQNKTNPTVDADSIEDAKFPDGIFNVLIRVADHAGNWSDTAAQSSTLKVHVDNFPPKVKSAFPADWASFVPTKHKTLFCTFSETMDTATIKTDNIKVLSLRDTTRDYTIDTLRYLKDSLKLYLKVNSGFDFNDTVQVRLLKGVHDLAGKSVGSSKGDTVAYAWTFVASLLQITDNDSNDVQPDVYHGKVVWQQGLAGSTGKIMMYDFQADSAWLISPNDTLFREPKIFGDRAAFLQYPSKQGNMYFYNPVWLYDGSGASMIAPGNRCRPFVAIHRDGMAWKSFYPRSDYYDTVWVEKYGFASGTATRLDTFVRYLGRSRGGVDMENQYTVWDASAGSTSEVKLYNADNGITENISNFPSQSDYNATISEGQTAWVQELSADIPGRIKLYDGAARTLAEAQWCFWPQIDNGKVAFSLDKYNNWNGYLNYHDGFTISTIDTIYGNPNYYRIRSQCLDNNQAAYLRFRNNRNWGYTTTTYNVSLYNANTGRKVKITDDTTRNSTKVAIHDGFVALDMWDGHDYEIYLYLADTLCTPPAVVQNVQAQSIAVKGPQEMVQVAWARNTESDLAGYKIYRSAVSHKFSYTPFATVAASDSFFLDTLPEPGDNHYAVTAYDDRGYESGLSSQALAAVALPSPQNLAAAYLAPPLRVDLSWQKPCIGRIARYYIYRSSAPGSYSSAYDSVSGSSISYTDINVTPETWYYYVVSARDSAGHVSGYSNEVSISPHGNLMSSTGQATAYNSGRRLFYDANADSLYLAYQSNEICFAKTGNGGAAWSDNALPLDAAAQAYPCLARTSSGEPCMAYLTGGGLSGPAGLSFAKYTGEDWQPVVMLPVPPPPYTGIYCSSPPAMAIEGDTCHLVIEKGRFGVWPSNPRWYLRYMKFLADNPALLLKDTLLDADQTSSPIPIDSLLPITSPTIALDDSGLCHVAYSRGTTTEYEDIFYCAETATGWTAPVNLTQTEGSSQHPMIDIYGDRLSLVWEEQQLEGIHDVMNRMLTLSSSVWSDTFNISRNPSNSVNPYTAMAGYVYWADDSTGRHSIYSKRYIDGLGWPDSTKRQITVADSTYDYPQLAFRQTVDTTEIHLVYTQGDSAPYKVTYSKTAVRPVSKIYIDGGTAQASPYCIHRDGYKTFGPASYQSVDNGNEYVSYRFAGLKSEKDYLVGLTYYWQPEVDAIMEETVKETTGNTDGIFWIEQLKFDNQTRSTNIILPFIKVSVEKSVPPELYEEDKEIILRVNRIIGGYAMATDVKLYELSRPAKEKNVNGGSQAANGGLDEPLTLVNALLQNKPNPFCRGITSIGFSLKSYGQASLKVYNTAGQLVRTIIDEPLPPGRYVANWDGKNEKGAQAASGIYLYRITNGEFSDTKKMTLIR